MDWLRLGLLALYGVVAVWSMVNSAIEFEGRHLGYKDLAIIALVGCFWIVVFPGVMILAALDRSKRPARRA